MDDIISGIRKSLGLVPGEMFLVSCDAGGGTSTGGQPEKWAEIRACEKLQVSLPGAEKITKKKYSWEVTGAVDEKKRNKKGTVEAVTWDDIISGIRKSLGLVPGEVFAIFCGAGAVGVISTQQPSPEQWEEMRACDKL